jgi:hypothetical protein
MKVKCIRLLDSDGRDVESSSWLKLGHTYHVLAWQVEADGKKFFKIISHEPQGEWPQIGNHSADCFEVVSNIAPSNWGHWAYGNAYGQAPETWQEPGFYDAFFDHEPGAYEIFDRERATILREDP